jgi:hypothetical protein
LAIVITAVYSFLIGKQFPFYLAGILNFGLGFLFPWLALGLTVLYLLYDPDICLNSKSGNKNMYRARSFFLIFPYGLLVFSIIVSFARGNQGDTFMKGMERYLTGHTDIVQIQKWQKTLDYDPNVSPTIIEEAKWPDFIKRIGPSHVQMDSRGNLIIGWGSGFYHWGWMIIPKGNEDVLPGNETRIPGSKSRSTPGGYLWIE